MKILILTVLLGLAYATDICEKIRGGWRTKYIASTDKSKTCKGGCLRAYVRNFTCEDGGDTVGVNFYVKTPECVLVTLKGTRTTGNNYITDYEGNNYFQFVHMDQHMLVIYIKNLDADGHETCMIEAFGKKILTKDQIKTYKDLARERNIAVENMEYIPKDDTCPK